MDRELLVVDFSSRGYHPVFKRWIWQLSQLVWGLVSDLRSRLCKDPGFEFGTFRSSVVKINWLGIMVNVEPRNVGWGNKFTSNRWYFGCFTITGGWEHVDSIFTTPLHCSHQMAILKIQAVSELRIHLRPLGWYVMKPRRSWTILPNYYLLDERGSIPTGAW